MKDEIKEKEVLEIKNESQIYLNYENGNFSDKVWVSVESLIDYIRTNAYDNGKEVTMVLDDDFVGMLNNERRNKTK